MKKIILTLTIAVLTAFLFSSCNKECYCTVKNGEDIIPGYDHQVVGSMTAKDCEAFSDSEWNRLGYTYTCTAE